MEPEEAKSIAEEILGKTAYRGNIAKNQLGTLRLLLENLGTDLNNKEIAKKLKENKVFPDAMGSEVARRQVIKAINDLEEKLQEYSALKDSNSKYYFIIQRDQGSGARLVYYQQTSSQVTRPLTFNLMEALIKSINHYSEVYGIPLDEVARKAFIGMFSRDKDYLGVMATTKKESAMVYVNKGGSYIDDITKAPKKK